MVLVASKNMEVKIAVFASQLRCLVSASMLMISPRVTDAESKKGARPRAISSNLFHLYSISRSKINEKKSTIKVWMRV
jgi:hypothetical protein